ncbi:MAG: DUF4249 family protein [Bacteroidales bacterium]|nr:DUF4249 family protein [Bacteroidales bacterium]
MKHFHYFALILLPILFLSCTREVSLDAEEKPEVVVECVLTNQRPQVLYLSLTEGPDESEIPTIGSAEILLKDLTRGVECGVFSLSEPGKWELDYRPVAEHRYRLEVILPGHELIWAEQTMPQNISVQVSGAWSPSASSAFPPPPIPKYGYDQGTLYNITFLPDYTWIYGLDYNEETEAYTIAEEICTDFIGVDNFNLTGKRYEPPTYQDGTTSFIYKEFMKSCEGWALYPHLIGQSIHWRYLHLQKSKLTAEELEEKFQISGNFSGDYMAGTGGTPKLGQGRLMFTSVSEDYDKYLQESVYFHKQQTSDNLSSIYVRENIFSNIQGGLGIFGAQMVSPVSWSRENSPINPVVY